MITLALICVLAAVVLGYYLRIKWKLNYWRRQGLEQPDHYLFSVGEQYSKAYDYLRKKGARFGGTYHFYHPEIVPADVDLIRDMLQTNFSHFVNHGMPYDEKKDPVSAHLFNLENEKWKNLRARLTPTFSSGKMKMMFQTVVDITPGLLNIFREHAKYNDPIDTKEVLARYTTDVIGSIAFGIECNSLKDPMSEFNVYGTKVFSKIGYRMIMGFLLPRFVAKLMFQKSQNEKSPSQFYYEIVKDMIKYRESNNIKRNDFFQLLLQLKNKGTIDEDSTQANNETGKITENEMAAQCFIFFLGGFETSSTTMNFALYELSVDAEAQEKLRKEIQETLAKDGGKITYDGIMSMKYMDKVVNETLRLHPPVTFIMRKCNKDYKVPESDYTIKAGTSIKIPIDAVHKDPRHWPNPDKFDPERFSPENKANRHPTAFIPFGEGPRICIGSRFGYLQTKVGLTAILSKFRVKLNKKTRMPVKLERNFTVNAIEGGLWLDVEEL